MKLIALFAIYACSLLADEKPVDVAIEKRVELLTMERDFLKLQVQQLQLQMQQQAIAVKYANAKEAATETCRKTGSVLSDSLSCAKP